MANTIVAPSLQASRKRRKKWNGVRFVAIDHPVLDSAAFAALSGPAAKALLLLLRRWHGPVDNNNGKLPLSYRDIQTYCHVRPANAGKVQRELAASGLAVPTQTGAFTWKTRHATMWRITFLPTATGAADWRFMGRQNLKVGYRSGSSTATDAVADGVADAPTNGSKKPLTATTAVADGAAHGYRSGSTSKVPSESALKAQPKTSAVVVAIKHRKTNGATANYKNGLCKTRVS